jgi:DNA (cytosine-5)-methyltransferase 1
MKIELKTGPWNLTDLESVPKNGLKVFSCFHCGGGSTMGYKLAGFNVLGGVEIDPKMMEVYRANHHPKHSYLMGVQDFKNIPNDKLPEELFNLDILDGSPPCSSFSMAGSREKAWGKNKKFREGQAEQVLDDLFFDFIAIAKKLQPKVVVAENVKGLIQGNARGYVKQIFAGFREAGYECQLFLLNASAMGVPQRRERTFFIANRLGKKIGLNFKEEQMPSGKAFIGVENDLGRDIPPSIKKFYSATPLGKSVSHVHPQKHFFNEVKLHPNLTAPTLRASGRPMHWEHPNFIGDKQCIRLQSFPDDYKTNGLDIGYVCGMSVPPFMMQRIANQIAIQFFGKNIDG